MSASNHITKVAIVGAGGKSGKHMTSALLATGKHTITALTRADSTNTFPDGVLRAVVDYSKPETFVAALRGQDALVITLSNASGIAESEDKLIRAAAEAGVPWILPNDWSPDSEDEALVRDMAMIMGSKVAARETIRDLGKSSYIGVSTGFWYEWSVSIGPALGFDFAKRTLTLFDEGETKVCFTTFAQVGRAVAAILSLPIMPEEGSNKEACLDNFRDKLVYVKSFTVSQKEILQSALRVTGTREDEWTITKETIQERYSTGIKEWEQGKRSGLAKKMWVRVFFPDGCGDVEHREGKGVRNELLGLPEEDIDEATKDGIEQSKQSNWTDGD